MSFYTASDISRPVRLSEDIRAWANESMHGKYGEEAVKNWAVEMDDIPGFAELPPIKKHDLALKRIAEKAPLRICPGEKLSGAATLGLAIRHKIPATFEGNPFNESVSHHTPNFRRVITEGMNSYCEQLEARLKDADLTENSRTFIESLVNVTEAMRIWHARYLEAAPEETRKLLAQVPFGPARTFREAVQSLWFIFAFMRLCGNWPGIGRIDWLLGEYLKNDIENGAITLDEAREVLASLFIKGCEWIEKDSPIGSGDAQHYQNIVLGGIGEDGNDITNDVTYLVLDIVEELGISDFPITIRIGEKTPDKLVRRAAEVMRHGGGIVAVYNEKLILNALERADYDPLHARRFANDGCWEVQLPGETCFGYLPFDGLQILSDTLGAYSEGPAPAYADMDALYAAFLEKLNEKIAQLYRDTVTHA